MPYNRLTVHRLFQFEGFGYVGAGLGLGGLCSLFLEPPFPLRAKPCSVFLVAQGPRNKEQAEIEGCRFWKSIF